MNEMTSHERFKRMFEHREADRVPIIDTPWVSTLQRWKREGMPEDADFFEYFGLENILGLGADNSPRYEVRTIEETDEYVVHTTPWGVTLRNWKLHGGTPEFLDFTIVDRESWAQAKERMKPTRDRVDWEYLKKHYKHKRETGAWVIANMWFGFDVTHSWMVGTERLLMAMVTDPDWCQDLFQTHLDLQIELFDMMWDEGYTFDCAMWPDDIAYKKKQFFSLKMYRDLLKPVHQKAVDWAHSKGAKVVLHTDGDVNPFVPEFIDMGFDGLNPIEVKAGMNPVELKRQYGEDLVFHGGINAVLWDDPEAIEAEIRRVVPVMKQNGGYIFSSDHSIPDSISLEQFKRIVALAKEVGSYG